MSRRKLIEMTDDEIAAYLAEPHLCRIGTIGSRGDVHLVAMNYGFVDGVVAFWTYRTAQKTKNLQRNPALSLPLLKCDGLPLGLQLLGFPNRERALSGIAAWTTAFG